MKQEKSESLNWFVLFVFEAERTDILFSSAVIRLSTEEILD